MKNNSLKYGFLSLGVCTAILLAPAMTNAEETPDNSSLGVELNLLDKQESDPALLNVELTNVPVVGDVKVRVPSKTEEGGAKKETLASVQVARGIIEDVDVSVLEESEEKTNAIAETKDSLVSVGVKSNLTKDLNIGVVSSEKNDSDSSSSYDGGLVEVNAEDLPLLGETHVGVLDKHVMVNEEGNTMSGGLVQADLDNALLKDTSVKVLAGEQSTSEATSSGMSAVADVHVGGGVLENVVNGVDVSLLKTAGSLDADSVAVKDSLVSAGLQSDLTNAVNVDVASSDFRVDEESYAYDGGLVEINADNLPLLGETHVGVLDKHVMVNEEGNTMSGGLVQADLNNALLKDTSVKVLAGEQSTSEAASSGMSAVADVHVGGGVLENVVNGVDVSLLKTAGSVDADSVAAMDSLVSAGLQSDLTKELNVDVASSDFRVDDDSYAYDGGLVEVNAEDLPLLGETHVGVLDQHVAVDGEEYSSSSSLIQAGLVDGLLDGTSLKVVGNEVETTDAGWLKTNTGLGLELGLPILDTVTVEVLKTQQLIPFAPEEENGTIPDGEAAPDEGTTIPGEEPNNPGTDKTEEPTTPGNGPTNPGEKPSNPGNDPMNPSEESTNPENDQMNPGEESTNPGNGPTNPGEESTNPGSGTTNPGSVPSNPGESSTNPGNGATNDNGLNPPYSGSDSSPTDGTFEVTDEDENDMPPLAAGSGGGSSAGPDSAVGDDEQADNSNVEGQDYDVTGGVSLNSSGQKKTNGVAGNMATTTLNDSDSRTSLPTTGGVWDANRLAIVAGLLLLAGVLLRLIGSGTIRLGRKSTS